MAPRLPFSVGVRILPTVQLVLKTDMFTLSIREEKESHKSNYQRKVEYKLWTGTIRIN